MSVVNKYIDSNNFLTAISVYNEESLITLAPDGYYQNNGTYRRQLNGLLGPSVLCEDCPPPFIPCSSSQSSGGVGITDYSVSLNSTGGLIAFLFNPQGVPDKLEIIHGTAAGTKKSTTGMNATDNYGPFDDVYGTETANTVPTNSQTLSIQQFIGTNKGTAATRLTEFTTETGYEVPSLIIGGVTYQQVVWWTYSNSDYLVNSIATIRVTGTIGTGWDLIRLCCPDGNCVEPTGTSYDLQNGTQSDLTYSYTTPSGVFVGGQFLGGFESITICAQTGSVSADTGISISAGGVCS